jgi:hypothetical protein
MEAGVRLHSLAPLLPGTNSPVLVKLEVGLAQSRLDNLKKKELLSP